MSSSCRSKGKAKLSILGYNEYVGGEKQRCSETLFSSVFVNFGVLAAKNAKAMFLCVESQLGNAALVLLLHYAHIECQ